ncbi:MULTISPECIES: hypothetical protein [Bacillus]|uniref:hypothetical protein n=1 Tax=Bacillus TaxID=1386 RepID=UPI0003806F46|nr:MULTISPECIES: hypothetical protein [Bacillus]MED1539121.1 hypothetical protein [Bacillus pseudomycoides]PGC41452.1 hypothetical protein COM18_11105 [Bacillus pseudomycoides]
MRELKYLVIHYQGYGANNIFEFETKGEAKEKIIELVENGERPSSIRMTKEIPTNIKVKVDVDF